MSTAVRQKKKGKLFSRVLWTVLTSIFSLLFIVCVIGSYCAVMLASSAINMMFGVDPTKEVGTTEQMRFESDWANPNGTGLFIEDKIMIRKAAAEGMVLLWNKPLENGTAALPIPKESRVSALSHSSVDIAESGGGSGAIDDQNTLSDEGRITTLKDALTRYYTLNDELWRFYERGDGSSYTRRGQRTGGWPDSNTKWYVNEVPWNVYEKSGVINTFADYGDAAIVVISRVGGENSDIYNSTENSVEDGGYLALTQEEKDLLQKVCEYREQDIFKRVVLVVNTGNTIQFGDFAPYLDNIDAALYMGQAGTSGVNALAELLVGNENPSGRLADTLVYNVFSHPSTAGDGRDSYSNMNKKIDGLCGSSGHYQHYTVYQEGIYVGYKYFETRYMDGIADPQGTNALSSAGAQNSSSGWNYGEEVAFPFGYGGSYTEFAWSDFKQEKVGDNYEISVTVTNEGDVAGKEVVQVYLSKPYTEHDKENDIEVAGVELVGFAKTKKLEPGEPQTVKITVPAESFKTYDANYDNGDGTFGRYVVEAGDYYLTAAADAHTAADNVLAAQGETPSSYSPLEGDRREAGRSASFAACIPLGEDASTYAVSTQTGEKVYNQLDSMDFNRYKGNGGQQVTYLSRQDWEGTYPKDVQLSANDDLMADLAQSFVQPQEATAENPMPEYGKFESGSTTGKPDTENGDLVAFDFIDAPLNEYDERWSDEWEEKWDQLLDQMTWYEQARLCTNAYHQIYAAESIALPYSKQENGPVGITKRAESNFQIPNKDITDWTYVCYPNAQVLASTFNVEIVEQIGQHKSEDMLYLGYNGIYGPGVNIHRNPFGGRNWEYYSEDPILSGLIGAAECKGIENKGCLAFAKHFAFNDMETYRAHNGIWCTEQAARELYLRAFELVFTEASATMNSFTRCGTTWSGMSENLQTNILRKEWGWDGLNITDWIFDKCMSKPDALFAGTNAFDGNGTPETYLGGWEKDPYMAQTLRESAKIIIYNVVSTHAMNGITRTTIIEEITPWWETTLYCIDVTFGVLAVGSAAMLVLSIVKDKKTKAASGVKKSSK